MTAWLDIAQAELGVHEQASGDSPRILEYLATVDTSAIGELHDEVSWCSAFVNWTMRQAGYVGTDSAAARSWLHWGKAIGWPKIGAIVVLSRGTEKWQGHVGFVRGTTANSIYVLAGNQGPNAVNIREFPFSRVLGYRWPKEEHPEKRIDMLPVPVIVTPEPRKTWRNLWGML